MPLLRMSRYLVSPREYLSRRRLYSSLSCEYVSSALLYCSTRALYLSTFACVFRLFSSVLSSVCIPLRLSACVVSRCSMSESSPLHCLMPASASELVSHLSGFVYVSTRPRSEKRFIVLSSICPTLLRTPLIMGLDTWPPAEPLCSRDGVISLVSRSFFFALCRARSVRLRVVSLPPDMAGDVTRRVASLLLLSFSRARSSARRVRSSVVMFNTPNCQALCCIRPR